MTVLKYWDGTAWVPAVVGRPGAAGEAFNNVDGGSVDSSYGSDITLDFGGVN